MATEKMYLVVEANWEYDDQYYSRAGSNLSVSPRAFKKKIDAVAEAQRLSIKEIKGNDIGGYAGGDSYDSLALGGKYGKLAELLTGDPDRELDYDDFKVPSDISDAKAAAILECLAIAWYDVVEVDVQG